MPDIPVFGEKEAKKGLSLLGFEIDEKRGKGGHSLAKHPQKSPTPSRQRPFITVPKRKEFGDPRFRADFVKEITAFGFTKEEAIEALRGKRRKGK